MSTVGGDLPNNSTEPRITAVSNNYYDEIIELSGSELDEFPTPTDVRTDEEEEAEDVAGRADEGMEADSRNPRGRGGDSPPSANLSASEGDYDESQSESGSEREEEEERAPVRKSHTGRPSAAPAGRSALGISSSPMPPPDSATILGDRFDDEADDYEDREDDDDGRDFDPAAGLAYGDPQTQVIQKGCSPGAKCETDIPRSTYSGAIDGDEELTELFSYIGRYKPQETELETELKAFIPDYVPAIGDIDAFIKIRYSQIPRPDKIPDQLGLTNLDEPSLPQSDPTVLDLRLRALSKSTHGAAAPLAVRALPETTTAAQLPKLVDAWIKNIRDLHAQKPEQTVRYTKRMPDVEELMQVWPPEFEEELGQVILPTAELDTPLAQYAQLLSLLLDIPLSGPAPPPSSAGTKKPPPAGGKAAPAATAASTHVVEALHVMFTLYSEFNSSAHFKALERAGGG
ncbi:Intraflagellar transport protein 46 [Geranomyces variabilis]|uniref:Intraflagellar transport protein 46 n=1 Tax=Geranomyces variabilis TaxID=109894 RepID=A0AAD5TCY7_9FUNG|nr:Intraflagellar transport protein 46 [Geranomyces variabilis]